MSKKRASVVQPRRAILIDTNILLLMVVGQCDPGRIQSFNPTKKYTAQDYLLVMRQLRTWGENPALITTPHILTEVSNLLGSNLYGHVLLRCRAVLARMIGQIREHREPARELCARASFLDLGITDAAIEQLSGKGTAVFTDDWELGALAERQGADVWNLHRLRSYPV